MTPIAFRFDFSANKGLGHLARCSLIAEQITKAYGTPTVAIVNELPPGNILAKNLLMRFGDVKVLMGENAPLPEHMSNADILLDAENLIHYLSNLGISTLLLDIYHANSDYQNLLAAQNIRWLQYDFKRAEKIVANGIININPSVTKACYEGLLPNKTQCLFGAKYAVINPKIASLKAPDIGKLGTSLLVCFGGGDVSHAFSWVLPQIMSQKVFSKITIIATSHPNNLHCLKDINDSRFTILYDQNEMSEHYKEHTIALVSGGTLAYEAIAAKRVTWLISLADNQVKLAQSWQQLKQAIYLGDIRDRTLTLFSQHSDGLRPDDIENSIEAWLEQQPIVDGKAAERIAQALVTLAN